MRKPLVVLGVAAAALVAGGAVTTRALAQEPPDDDFSGFNVFGEPLFDGAGDEYVEEEPDSDVVDVPRIPDVTPGSTLPEAPGGGSAHRAQRPAEAPSGEPAEPSEEPADEPSAGPAEEPKRAPARIKAETPRKNYGFAAAADPIAASRTAVTAQSISSSPVAPVQQQILALVNRYRERAGCRPVTIDRRLIDAANRHAADMARRDYFEHASPNGDRAGERVSEAGYSWRWYGENIARGQDSPWEAMDGWMNSPEHRENILDCKLDQMGVGLALDRDDTPYWVQDFATPK
ncbi:CAP domain-containing protein [Actinoplanes oblitus]|uniref:CAP domain-containing protein n=1 Tax=Actinoplanes oblitus TaxID=3040509 RepID=A0ABY8WD77_9ACTN|nr:CAP domain-containing protein [Actinoplanes oblitus]WIM93675.1 CAP domain-containing protein [Actinoplanes oblitus]